MAANIPATIAIFFVLDDFDFGGIADIQKLRERDLKIQIMFSLSDFHRWKSYVQSPYFIHNF